MWSDEHSSISARSRHGNGPAMLASSLCAALAFLVVYSVKVYFYNGMLIEGFTTPVQCWALIVGKLPATLVNGGLAVICAPVLGSYFVIFFSEFIEISRRSRFLHKRFSNCPTLPRGALVL